MRPISSEFLSGLHIRPSHRIIAVVGSGGKTSLIWRLAEELVQAGKKWLSRRPHIWQSKKSVPLPSMGKGLKRLYSSTDTFWLLP